ncbi:unnamed protein product [Ceratitis capitata]|uniref:(Mediterranean fruit fly) hypothetical protein n=1 Tax=Ceratitis capitata TaxID=7213 RepID=A0A811U8I0_CERCA|nr:unnamed protein product [Ceratitis capitata]
MQIVIIQIVIYTFLLINISKAKELNCKVLMLRGKPQKVCQTCDMGYVATKDGCSPICAKRCDTNEHCSAPNVCKCNMGYTRDLSGKCSPICNKTCDETSYCSKPDVCACRKGYVETNYGCTPICVEPCGENEYCAGPDNCSCNAGYSRNITGKCVPLCNPVCNETSYCSKPDMCACRKGYVETNVGCSPICTNLCGENEYCSAPNNCTCKDGFAKDFNGKCSPICDRACDEVSFCSAPNKCTCKTGYERTKDGCSPICAQACVNGRCVAPNKCLCNTGYQHVNEHDYNCQPECDINICGNATCSQPNVCECPKGYERINGTRDCLPACTAGCGPYGICVESERCDCVEGYRRSGDLCVPQCKHGCGNNERCVQPDVCQCMDGYENKPLRHYDHRCQPMCEPSCPLNAYCAAPNDCSCYAGYTLVDRVCVPRCKDQCGADSSCIAPDQCHCNRGFLEQDGKCVSSAELRSCMKEVLFIKVPVSCETGSFIIYLIYAGLIGILLLCGFITYKSILHLHRRSSKSYRPPPENFIVTYQPRSRDDDIGDADCEVASPSYSQPPAYNTLTRKSCRVIYMYDRTANAPGTRHNPVQATNVMPTISLSCHYKLPPQRFVAAAPTVAGNQTPTLCRRPTSVDGCEPNCAEGCGEHSRCKAPNKCVCDESCALQADGECGPVCKPELYLFFEGINGTSDCTDCD